VKSQRRHRCRDCGELKDGVISGLCESCEDNYEWCNVCREHIDRDDGLHRHLFWTENGFAGSGAYEGDWPDSRDDVRAFLQACPIELAIAIRHGIAAGEFNLFFTASMLGGHAHILAKGLPSGFYCLHEYFDQRALSESALHGLKWLFTLYENDTAGANAVTVEWIDEWLGQRLRHDRLMMFHSLAAASPAEGGAA
jgi:hypothetical protein